ncbi:CCA tRNA nucleotidyltransferase [Acetobacteraceae bacterium ESL0709]|nr:CCA tRNA nucleotidyltransferase [Acetobacteraceae bacterium ESL0697]MDF7678645.1 CCA tRNA nucleotidyltransferase [Acetobacteraceae bacterium ESL0709]
MQKKIRMLAGYAGLECLWEVLPEARLVGGCVRDLLAGREVHDMDLAVPCVPEETMRLLGEAGIRTIPTGLDHGTVTAVMDHRPYEITTLRRDVETDGRHAVVAWTDDWQEDAERRDFTINALSLDRNGQLYDYFGGQQDLKDGRVRFVGQARKRIEEDALRALRFFRFQARYGKGAPDSEACMAVRECRALVRFLSIERVVSELFKILEGPQLWDIMVLMEETGLLEEILPHASLSSLRRLLDCQDPPHALSRLFALDSDPDLGTYFRLSRLQCHVLKAYGQKEPALVAEAMDDELRRLRFRQDLPVLMARSWLRQAEEVGQPSPSWSRFRERLAAQDQPVFPLTGRDGLACGLVAGPELGRWLKEVQAWWLEQGCRPEKEACLDWLRARIALRSQNS